MEHPFSGCFPWESSLHDVSSPSCMERPQVGVVSSQSQLSPASVIPAWVPGMVPAQDSSHPQLCASSHLRSQTPSLLVPWIPDHRTSEHRTSEMAATSPPLPEGWCDLLRSNRYWRNSSGGLGDQRPKKQSFWSPYTNSIKMLESAFCHISNSSVALSHNFWLRDSKYTLLGYC